MQILNIKLKDSFSMSVSNQCDSPQLTPTFANFVDAFRLSVNPDTDNIFIFENPFVLVRMSQVALVSVGFKKNSECAFDENGKPEVVNSGKKTIKRKVETMQ